VPHAMCMSTRPGWKHSNRKQTWSATCCPGGCGASEFQAVVPDQNHRTDRRHGGPDSRTSGLSRAVPDLSIPYLIYAFKMNTEVRQVSELPIEQCSSVIGELECKKPGLSTPREPLGG
jgi:hypothetical protein